MKLYEYQIDSVPQSEIDDFITLLPKLKKTYSFKDSILFIFRTTSKFIWIISILLTIYLCNINMQEWILKASVLISVFCAVILSEISKSKKVCMYELEICTRNSLSMLIITRYLFIFSLIIIICGICLIGNQSHLSIWNLLDATFPTIASLIATMICIHTIKTTSFLKLIIVYTLVTIISISVLYFSTFEVYGVYFLLILYGIIWLKRGVRNDELKY